MPKYVPTAKGLHRDSRELPGQVEEADSPQAAKAQFESQLDTLARVMAGEGPDENTIVAVRDIDTGEVTRFD